MRTKTLDRQAVREALAKFEDAKRQHDKILHDKDIQQLFEQEQIKEAYDLCNARYPDGKFERVQETGLELIHEMIKGIPEYDHITPQRIWRSAKFERFVEVAKKV